MRTYVRVFSQRDNLCRMYIASVHEAHSAYCAWLCERRGRNRKQEHFLSKELSVSTFRRPMNTPSTNGSILHRKSEKPTHPPYTTTDSASQLARGHQCYTSIIFFRLGNMAPMQGARYRALTLTFLCRDSSGFWVDPTPHTQHKIKRASPPTSVPTPTHSHTQTLRPPSRTTENKAFLRVNVECSILCPHLHFISTHKGAVFRAGAKKKSRTLSTREGTDFYL